MARHKLTATRARSAAQGWHGDGDGLWLRVTVSGSRSWVFVSIRRGVRRELGLGGFGSVTLAQARAKAEEVRCILGAGGDPFTEMAERQARVRVRTFGDVAAELIATKAPTFKHPKDRRQWEMTLGVYAASLAKIPVTTITTDDVVAVLRPLWAEKPETARRLRGRIESVIDYATALGLRGGENPARWKGHLDHLLGKPQGRAKHFAAMAYGELPAFWPRLAAVDTVGSKALQFAILTAARSAEVIGAEWSEIDLDGALWTIPPSRMKAGVEHVVPLSEPALALLRAMHAVRMSHLVFPGRQPDRPLAHTALADALRRLCVDRTEASVHGFRSSFRDWCGDATSYPREIAEMALAHKVGDATEQAYRRGSALQKRARLMAAWAAYVTTKPTGNVVAITSPTGAAT